MLRAAEKGHVNMDMLSSYLRAQDKNHAGQNKRCANPSTSFALSTFPYSLDSLDGMKNSGQL